MSITVLLIVLTLFSYITGKKKVNESWLLDCGVHLKGTLHHLVILKDQYSLKDLVYPNICIN